MPEISNANELRGAEFKSLVRKPLSWVWIGLLAVALAIGGAFIGPAFAGAGFAVGLLIGLIIALAVADHRAEEAFFDSYAETRSLTRSETQLGGVTPILRKGDTRKVNEMFTGRLNDEFDGSLVLYTYTEEHTDSKGNKTETNYPFTLAVFNLPETTPHLAELLVQRKSGFKALEGLEDKFRGNHERVTLESEAMRDRYEIFVTKQQDPVWVRRLFSPSFIVWLTDAPPKKFAFELVAGTLVAIVPKHRDNAEGLDQMITIGCTVARRLTEEVVETS